MTINDMARDSGARGGRARRPRTVLIAALMLLVVAAAASVRLGAVGLSWHEFMHAYLDYHGTTDDVIVWKLRTPRALVSIEVGAALAVAGTLIQGVTRNPLADPGILGINSGAALFVVLAIDVFGARTPEQFMWFAFPGAALGTLLGFSLALAGKGRPTPLKLTLAGVITSSLLGAATEGVIALRADIDGAYSLWALGDVGGATIGIVEVTGPVVVIGLLLALPLGRSLNAMALGEDTARSLGQHVMRTRVTALAAIVLLAGAAVAATGPMVFVGVAVPNAVRSLIGNDYRWLLPISAVAGGVFVLAADLVGRLVIRPGELQTGIIIAIVGGPIFLALVTRRNVARV